MTEKSIPWPGEATLGDDGPYTDEEWSEIWRDLVHHDLNDNSGIVPNVGTELLVIADAPVSAQIDIGVGNAFVHGTWFQTDIVVAKTISANASGNPRIDTVILQKDWTGQEVRIVVREGTPAGTPVPVSLVQTDGVTWEIPLADVAVANGFSVINAVDITDRRATAGAASSVGNPVLVTIASGTFARTNPFHIVAAESGSADVLNSVTGGQAGDILILTADTGDTNTLAYGTGAGEFEFSGLSDIDITDADIMILIHNGTNWSANVSSGKNILRRGCMLSKASQSINSSTPTAILFPSEVEDTDGYHDNGSNTERITIPSHMEGLYFVRCHCSWPNSTSDGTIRQLFLHLDGTQYEGSVTNPSASQDQGLTVSAFLRLTAAQYVHMLLNHNGTVHSPTRLRLEAYLIGR